jgi:hypothetical protein
LTIKEIRPDVHLLAAGRANDRELTTVFKHGGLGTSKADRPVAVWLLAFNIDCTLNRKAAQDTDHGSFGNGLGMSAIHERRNSTATR